MAIEPDGSELTGLLELSPSDWASDPSWSPDGATLAYTLTIPADHPTIGWLRETIICGLDRQTGKGNLLAPADAWTTWLQDATWTPDSQALLVTLDHLHFDADNTFTGSTKASGQYDLSTSTWQVLAANTMSPVLAPDKQRLAYIRIDPQTGSMGLEIGQRDGQNGQAISAAVPAFSHTASPRWSPDGGLLMFVADSPPLRSAPQQQQIGWILEHLLSGTVAQAHGPPSDLWIVDRDGEHLHQLTHKRIDDPRGAWSPDGQQLVYTVGSTGEGFEIFLYDLRTGKEKQLTDNGGNGGITWTAPED